MRIWVQDDLLRVAKVIAEQSHVLTLCSYNSRCPSVLLSALFAWFAIYFNRNLFISREHNQKAARSPLLLCKMFSKSATLHLSPNYKIPSPRLEHCVKAEKPQLDRFIKLTFIKTTFSDEALSNSCVPWPMLFQPWKQREFLCRSTKILSASVSTHHLSNQGIRIF